jgi:hypothetical protein
MPPTVRAYAPVGTFANILCEITVLRPMARPHIATIIPEAYARMTIRGDRLSP